MVEVAIRNGLMTASNAIFKQIKYLNILYSALKETSD